MAFVHSTPLQSTFTTSTSTTTTTTSICPRTTPTMTEAHPIFRTAAAAALAAGAILLTNVAPLPADAALFHIRGDRPANLGVKYARYLESCPSTPNCISSSANVYDSHFVPAWTYNIDAGKSKSMDEAITDLKKVLANTPRAEIIKSEPVKSDQGSGYYVYAEFESKLMGYIDDVEFFFRPDATTVEYRSASRLGERDFDANRKRIRDLRVALQETDSRWGSVGY